jgi:hypothetical protein
MIWKNVVVKGDYGLKLKQARQAAESEESIIQILWNGTKDVRLTQETWLEHILKCGICDKWSKQNTEMLGIRLLARKRR